MKAVVFDRFGGPEVLRLADLEVPVPGPGQVLVQMRSAGVCKADWRVRTGRCQWLDVPFPVTLGYEGAGVVAALGPGVSGFSIGQPVHVLHMACYGTYAEYTAVTADDVVEMPEGLDFDIAATAFNYFVAWGLLSQIVQAEE
jgi:NADPH:quinone reductase-like Zn-dependent oxidoreductase